MKTKRDNITRRILVLGSTNHTKLVTAYEWDKLPRNLNVSDFETVILNFTPFQNSEFAQQFSGAHDRAAGADGGDKAVRLNRLKIELPPDLRSRCFLVGLDVGLIGELRRQKDMRLF